MTADKQSEAACHERGLCVMPFIGLHVTTDGEVKPCCEYDGSMGHVSDGPLETLWAGAAFEQLRARFREGQDLPGCWKCWDREAGEGASLRLHKNGQYSGVLADLETGGDKPRAPLSLDFRGSNLCNLKCRTCYHGASSRWFTDARALGLTHGPKAEISHISDPQDMARTLAPFLDSLQEVYFAGGEPLLMPQHQAVLDLLEQAGRCDVRLSYNTNLCIRGMESQRFFEQWQRFRKLDLNLSVDASGAAGGLIRSGFDWALFLRNVWVLRSLLPHAELSFGITVSALNLHLLPNLMTTLIRDCGAVPGRLLLHSLQDPPYYSVQVLPEAEKATARRAIMGFLKDLDTLAPHDPRGAAYLTRQLNGVMNYADSRDLTDLLPTLREMTQSLDRLRGERTADILPGLAGVLAP